MTIYAMPQVEVNDWNGKDAFPTVDQYSYRQVEGHGSEKAFRYNGFEKTRTNNPNVLHTYQSDDYLRFERLFTSGNLAVGDSFILGIGAPEMTELDFIVVRQRNTIAGLTLKITVMDGNFQPVEDEGIEIDFSETCTNGRWNNQPVQKFRYDNSGTNAMAGENELYFLVAEIVTLPDVNDWFTDCANSELPQFQVRVHYNDSCLNATEDTAAPVSVYNAYAAAVNALTEQIIVWREIPVSKGTGGFDELPAPPPDAALLVDTDSDGVPDFTDIDDDGNGILDIDE